MMIHLPQDLESSLKVEVSSGHFASLDNAIAEVVR
jgi:Arc/MetJ-type ribon-helix-helix transcriptional regulator